MLSASEIQALELRGLTYWRCNGKDLALDLKNIEGKRDTLANLGIDLIVKDNCIILQPHVLSEQHVDTVTALPLIIDKQTLKKVESTGVERIPARIHVLDLSDVYICPEDLMLIRRLASVSGKVIVSGTLDRPDITSLKGLFSYSQTREFDFTDFRGTYVTNIRRLFTSSKCESIKWDFFDMSNIKNADSAFMDTKNLRGVNLSTLPMLDCSTIFTGSALPYPYTSTMLRTGMLQEWCRSAYGCLFTTLYNSKTLGQYVVSQDVWDNFNSIIVKDNCVYRLGNGTVFVYSSEGINFDDMFHLFTRVDYQEFANFLFNVKPALIFPDNLDASNYTSEFLNLIFTVYE